MKTSNLWLLDSRASQHMCQRKELFTNLTPSAQKIVKLADGKSASVIGTGSYVNCLKQTLKNVFCVPSLENNLLSVSSLDRDGYTINFEKCKRKVMKNGTQMANGYLKDHLYMMNQSQMNEAINVVNNLEPHEKCIHSLRRKLGHVSFEQN